jgi:hypothetical protein
MRIRCSNSMSSMVLRLAQERESVDLAGLVSEESPSGGCGDGRPQAGELRALMASDPLIPHGGDLP